MKINYSIQGLAGASLILFGSGLASRAQTELMINGGFESGPASSPPGWIVGGGAEAYPNPVAHSGSRFLFLGGIENEVDYAYQTITIPSGAGSATLRRAPKVTVTQEPLSLCQNYCYPVAF